MFNSKKIFSDKILAQYNNIWQVYFIAKMSHRKLLKVAWRLTINT